MSARSQLAATLIVASLSIALTPLASLAGGAVKTAVKTAAKTDAPLVAPAQATSVTKLDSKAIAAVMARIDRGKSQLDRSHKLKAAGLRLQALKRATLSLERTLADVERREGDVYEVLTEQARSLLVHALNGRTKIELERGRLDRATKLNNRARKLAAKNPAAKTLAKKISSETIMVAPPTPAQNVLPTAAELAAAQRAQDYANGYLDGLDQGRRTSGLLGYGSTFTGSGFYPSRYYGGSIYQQRLDGRRTSRSSSRRNRRSRGRTYSIGSGTGHGHSSSRRSYGGGAYGGGTYGDGGRVGTPSVRGGSGNSISRFSPSIGSGGSVMGHKVTRERVYSRVGGSVLGR